MWIGHNWVVLPVIALTIFSLTQKPGMIGATLSLKPVLWLGKISYSFYSLQLLLLLYLQSNHGALVEHFPALGDNVILLAVSLLVLIGMSGLSYHLVEEPARLWLTSRARKEKRIVALPEDNATPVYSSVDHGNAMLSSASGGGVINRDDESTLLQS
jgi:peptidoglycan/LPS O-acetylase OafA/YrhL